jgi:hypothetical protein
MNTIERELSLALQREQELFPRDHTHLHCSALAGCRRLQGYQLMGAEALPPESHFLSICDLGHGLHLQMLQRLSSVGPLAWARGYPVINHGRFAWRGNIELPVFNEEYGLCGSMDAFSEPLKEVDGRLVRDTAGDRYVIDIKTITARTRINRVINPETGVLHEAHVDPSSFAQLTGIKPEHRMQVTLYAWMATQPGFEAEGLDGPLPAFPRLMVIYIGKDVEHTYYDERHPDRRLLAPYRVFTEDVDPAVLEEALARAAYIHQKIKAGTWPAKDHSYSSTRRTWQCEVCAYRHHCFPKYFGPDGRPLL